MATKRRGEVKVEIFAAGDGINYPRAGHTVTVHYTAYLTDGTQWDSSRDRGKPFKFKLGMEQVHPHAGDRIAVEVGKLHLLLMRDCLALTAMWLCNDTVCSPCIGLDEGVSQLSIGERAKITIPPEMAYGDRGFPGLVPKGSTLIFDLELITFS